MIQIFQNSTLVMDRGMYSLGGNVLGSSGMLETVGVQSDTKSWGDAYCWWISVFAQLLKMTFYFRCILRFTRAPFNGWCVLLQVVTLKFTWASYSSLKTIRNQWGCTGSGVGCLLQHWNAWITGAVSKVPWSTGVVWSQEQVGCWNHRSNIGSLLQH